MAKKSRVTEEDVLAYIKETPIAQLGPMLTVFADRVYAHRLANRGYVPIEIFEELLGPVTVSVQIVHEVVNHAGEKIGYALRRREPGEVGRAYEGKYHNVCTSLRWFDTIEAALARNDADAFGGTYQYPYLNIGMTYHHEVPRRNMDLTFMFYGWVREHDVEHMRGDWKVFSYAEILGMKGQVQEDIPIVLSNVYQLEWAMNPNRSRFGVLHGTFPEESQRG